jgi:hypothetical protein
MLERYGVYENPDGSFARIDTQQSADQVTRDLRDVFGFNPAVRGNVIFAGDEINPVYRMLMEKRGSSLADLESFHQRLVEATEVGGGATYSGDLELGLDPHPDYLVFMSVRSSAVLFPIVLAEEITHGEHMAGVINWEGISFPEYRSRFSSMTEEFLGYIGRKKIIEAAGLVGGYEPIIDLSREMTEDDWAHKLAYLAVDDLFENNRDLPLRELFRAPDEETFWKIAKEAVSDGVKFGFKFPAGRDYAGLKEWIDQFIKRSKADVFIETNYSVAEVEMDES